VNAPLPLTTPSATLPVQFDAEGLRMDSGEARGLGDLFKDDYANADPFPHIVLDDFLPQQLIDAVLRNFPDEQISGEVVHNYGYGGEHKRQVPPEESNRFNRELFWFLNSQPVLQFLEGLSGIEGLLPDPYFVGGGFHEIGRGGRLGVHADFRINQQLHVQRRLNLLIYLNPAWDEAWKGHLELWSKDMTRCVQKVAPLLNRCVVFSTDAQTWHGHPDPLETPEHVKRRSIALYYYTASKSIYQETPAHSTMYMARPEDAREIHDEARRFRVNEYLKDWLPPVGYRAWQKANRLLGGRRGPVVEPQK